MRYRYHPENFFFDQKTVPVNLSNQFGGGAHFLRFCQNSSDKASTNSIEASVL